MNILIEIKRRLTHSLATRLAGWMTFAVGASIAILLGFAYHEMDYQVGKQGAIVRQLAREKAGEQIDTQISLTKDTIEVFLSQLSKNLDSITSLRSTSKAVMQRNDVEIAMQIGQKAIQLGFTGAMILDAQGYVIGMDRTDLELVFANVALNMHPLGERIRKTIHENNPIKEETYRFVGMFDASYAAIFQANIQDQFGVFFISPVVNEFGEGIGAIAAYRIFLPSETWLTKLADMMGAKIALIGGNHVITTARIEPQSVTLQPIDNTGLQDVPSVKGHARCDRFFAGISACVIRPDSEIEHFVEQLMALGREQFASTRNKLALLGASAVLVVMLLLFAIAQNMIYPLVEITRLIKRVTKGEWRVEITHKERSDEVGQVARAIASLQNSLVERDQMRQQLLVIEEANKRRLTLDTASQRFENGMAVVMKNITDTVWALANTNETINEAAKKANIQVEAIRSTSVQTASKTHIVTRTTMELSRIIREIGERAHHAGMVVNSGDERARAVEMQLGFVNEISQAAERGVLSLQDYVSEINSLGLAASLEAAHHVKGDKTGVPIAQSFNIFTEKLFGTIEGMSKEIAKIDALTQQASGNISGVREVLTQAFKETHDISVAVEEQSAVTREIADGIAHSAEALIGLADAVDQLHESLNHALDASSEFVATARTIAEDAREIDGSIRSFIREVSM